MSKNRQLSFVSRGKNSNSEHSAHCIKSQGLAWPAMMLVGLVLCIAAAAARATPVAIETAAPPTTTTGVMMNDAIWLFHRFEIASPSQLESVGGTFVNYSESPVDVFGAIVELSGPDDFPDSLDLSTPDLLGTTLITVSPTDAQGAEFENVLSLDLASGWYALGFGTGAFGASSVPITGVWLGMPHHTNDLDRSQFVFSAFQPELASLGFIGQSVAARFHATYAHATYAHATYAAPEPATLALLALGLTIVLASSRRARQARGVGIRMDRWPGVTGRPDSAPPTLPTT